MSEAILTVLMRLFAIVANVNREGVSSKARTIVETYLKRQLNKEQVARYLSLFDEYLALHHRNIDDQNSVKARKRGAVNAVKVLKICQQINQELEQEQKVLVLLQLLEYIKYVGQIGEKELDFIATVADTFNINKNEYKNCKAFILDSFFEIPDQQDVLVINNKSTEDANELYSHLGVKHIYDQEMDGKIVFLHIPSTNMYVFHYDGKENIYLNGQVIETNWGYSFDVGSSIRGSKIKTIYYSDIANQFLKGKYISKITFTARNIEFKYVNSEKGVKNFSFSEESGQLIGVMGGSGVGKSTLINVLNGNIKPNKGEIYINGYDIHEEKDYLKGIVGYIPQDDLLVEELTVYQNLYYNAKLCFSNYSAEEIKKLVTKTLRDLDLYDIKDLTVGNPLKKTISGGQRKRLNIALELLRSPAVLFVDEPTTGLSSMDSEMVMDLLKEQTLKGKLIIVNIHQPSSDIYKLFDKIIILDKGGYPVYQGNPVDAVVYFKSITNHINAKEGECFHCGNVNPEQVLKIVEAKVVNEYGRLTRNRKIPPKEWNSLYKKNIEKDILKPKTTDPLPKTNFKIPNKFKQFKIFAHRDILAKITNRQYLLINLLEAPALAIIIGYFTKYISGSPENPDKYLFSLNENVPVYIFMSVIVSLFIGLTVSAQEIIKDRKILKRESFLNLSKNSYLNAKILIVFFISAVEMMAFVLIGNTVLELKDMTISYWLILFSTACFANMLGLNISAGMNSIVNIYILIPFLLVPQLLFGGVIVRFDKLHKEIASDQYVPVIGDIMTSRWAYEALAVHQFKDNKFEKNFYNLEKDKSNAAFMFNFLIPELNTIVDETKNIKNEGIEGEEYTNKLHLLKNELITLQNLQHGIPFNFINKIEPKAFNSEIAHLTKQHLDDVKSYYIKVFSDKTHEVDNKYREMLKKMGSKEKVNEFKADYHNESLADLLLKRKQIQKLERKENKIVRKSEPIYMPPKSNYGRSHFYAPYKKIGNNKIDTYWFNFLVIWLMNLLLYISLRTDALKKLIELSENKKIIPQKKENNR